MMNLHNLRILAEPYTISLHLKLSKTVKTYESLGSWVASTILSAIVPSQSTQGCIKVVCFESFVSFVNHQMKTIVATILMVANFDGSGTGWLGWLAGLPPCWVGPVGLAPFF